MLCFPVPIKPRLILSAGDWKPAPPITCLGIIVIAPAPRAVLPMKFLLFIAGYLNCISENIKIAVDYIYPIKDALLV
jgi:hypothetical protein